ncbi:MAG: hypothetical protein LBC08_04290 [Campylobacteraceae bacterium]|jgi:hypothetical protein|nr:hypothetical protein [Campylobacteraceae bacterium]
MFTEGILGTMLFASISIIFMLMLSIVVFGSITLFLYIFKEKKIKKRVEIFKNKTQRNTFVVVFAINIIFFTAIIMYRNDLSPILIYLIVVAMYISSLNNNGFKILLMFYTLFICFAFSNTVSSIVSDSLKAFGVGGDIATVIYTKNNQQESGKLKMITPRNVYIQQDNKSIITIIPIDNIEKIDNSIEVKKGII